MKLGYTGAYRDPLTELYPLGNGYRFYLPELMCFNKADSLSPFGAGGINTRSYCEGDPINHSDPSGHMRHSQRPWKAAPKDGIEIIENILELATVEAIVPEAAPLVIGEAIEATLDIAESERTVSAQITEANNAIDKWLGVLRQNDADTESPVRSTAPETQENIASTSAATTAPKRPAEDFVEPATAPKRPRLMKGGTEPEYLRQIPSISPNPYDEWTIPDFLRKFYGRPGLTEEDKLIYKYRRVGLFAKLKDWRRVAQYISDDTPVERPTSTEFVSAADAQRINRQTEISKHLLNFSPGAKIKDARRILKLQGCLEDDAFGQAFPFQ